jgi:hypothetical protein
MKFLLLSLTKSSILKIYLFKIFFKPLLTDLLTGLEDKDQHLLAVLVLAVLSAVSSYDITQAVLDLTSSHWQLQAYIFQ